MVKNCKAKGTVLENDFKKYFEKWGFEVIRAAGSFGTDLVALARYIRPVIINCKWRREYFTPMERYNVLDTAFKIDGIALLAYKHIPKGKTRGIHCMEIINDINTQGDQLLLEPLKVCSEDYFERLYFSLDWEQKVYQRFPPDIPVKK